MGVEVQADYYGALFYAMTGTMTAIVIAGLSNRLLAFTVRISPRAMVRRVVEWLQPV